MYVVRVTKREGREKEKESEYRKIERLKRGIGREREGNIIHMRNTHVCCEYLSGKKGEKEGEEKERREG